MTISTKDNITGNIDINDVVRKILADLGIGAKVKIDVDVAVNAKEAGGKVGEVDDEELSFGGYRVISLDDVNRKFENNQSQKVLRIVVPPKCVLTPSAKDEIKKRGLRIIVRKIGIDNRPLWLALHGNITASTSLLKQLQSEYNLTQNKFIAPAEIADEAVKVTGQNKQGIILTQQPATILRATSLREVLRVILAIEPKQVSIDTKEINANLMIIPPTRISESNILESVRSFVKIQ
ncbi:MAG: hypothetical protein LBK06_00925 [Planctomycetaceae bacterium]|nr:hypothetical protein [Planctomycetaceae bacterium]